MVTRTQVIPGQWRFIQADEGPSEGTLTAGQGRSRKASPPAAGHKPGATCAHGCPAEDPGEVPGSWQIGHWFARTLLPAPRTPGLPVPRPGHLSGGLFLKLDRNTAAAAGGAAPEPGMVKNRIFANHLAAVLLRQVAVEPRFRSWHLDSPAHILTTINEKEGMVLYINVTELLRCSLCLVQGCVCVCVCMVGVCVGALRERCCGGGGSQILFVLMEPTQTNSQRGPCLCLCGET